MSNQTLKLIEPKSITLLDYINRGSYGVVFMGNLRQYEKPDRTGSSLNKRSSSNLKVVAVKFIDDDVSFRREEQNLATVSHENIIKIFGKSTWHDGRNVLIMEYADYGCLYDVLHGPNFQQYCYTPLHAIGWCLQCARGVKYLHNQKPIPLLHRDLKTANLLLFNSGRLIKICDFGTARTFQHSMTVNIGTACYMAPEVFRDKHYTEKCDVYSWAIVLWEVLARQRPFRDWSQVTPRVFLYQLCESKIRPPQFGSQCPTELTRLLTRAWNDDPIVRPPMNEIVTKMVHFQNFVLNKKSKWENLKIPFQTVEIDEEQKVEDRQPKEQQNAEPSTNKHKTEELDVPNITSAASSSSSFPYPPPSLSSSSSSTGTSISSSSSQASNHVPSMRPIFENDNQFVDYFFQNQFEAYRWLGYEQPIPNISSFDSINLHNQLRRMSVLRYRQELENILLINTLEVYEKMIDEQREQEERNPKRNRNTFVRLDQRRTRSIQYEKSLREDNQNFKTIRARLIEQVKQLTIGSPIDSKKIS